MSVTRSITAVSFYAVLSDALTATAHTLSQRLSKINVNLHKPTNRLQDN